MPATKVQNAIGAQTHIHERDCAAPDDVAKDGNDDRRENKAHAKERLPSNYT